MSEVVIVGSNQYGLVRIGRIGPGQVTDDVVYPMRLPVFALINRKTLEIAAIVTGGCKAGVCKFAGDVGGRLLQLRGAQPAAFHLGRGKIVDVLFQPFLGKDRREFGERFAGRVGRGSRRTGGALFRAA